MGALGSYLRFPFAALAAAQGQLFPWVPVCVAAGIGLWFSLPTEPGMLFYGVTVLVLLASLTLRVKADEIFHAVAIAVLCTALGVMAAGARAHLVAAPILEFRYYGPVQGRVVTLDRSQTDHPRLTLDQVVLDKVSPQRTPGRVRVALHGDDTAALPVPGTTIALTAHLSGPDGPVEPGGFDFQRMAFFDGLGAVGYSRTALRVLAEPMAQDQRINRIRSAIRAEVERQIGGDPGAFAAALVTGDRAGISQETLEDLRKSNLAHLLAISGLHMGLLTGFIFAALRYGLALIPLVALRANTKKIAAVVALAGGGIYFLLSGGNVATERAYIMVSVMLVAVLLDRRALSLRSVSIAALVLLLLQPETLLEPGFQMSFAATVALVAGFGALRGRIEPHKMRWWITPLFTLVFSSVLAGFATAPIGAAHFNRIAGYGLLANLLAVPVMGSAVMPAAVLAGLLAPLGLEAPALWVMEQGTAWILHVARLVANADGAVTAVPSPHPFVLPMMALGAIWLILWQGGVRWAGLVPVCLAFGLWGMTERAPLLISKDGTLVGLMGDNGRALSAAKGAGFAARQWLENDGDPADQISAAQRDGFSGPGNARRFDIGGWQIVQLKGKSAVSNFAAACKTADIVIVGSLNLPKANGGCLTIDKSMLGTSGPLAVWPAKDGSLVVEPTHKASRYWARNPAAKTITLVTRDPEKRRIAADQ